MLKQFIKETPFGLSILVLAIAAGFILLIAPLAGNKALIVRSGSMQPTINVGDLITVNPQTNYQIGDIIAFRDLAKSSVIVTHRLVDIQEQNGQIVYQTKGDANDDVDAKLIPKENLIGRADYSIRGLGKVLAMSKTQNGFIALVIGPAILVIFFEISNIIKEVRKNRRRIVKQVYYDIKKIKTAYEHYGKPMGLPHPADSFRNLFKRHSRGDFSFTPQDFGKWRLHLRSILPILTALLLIGNTNSFFSDTETSTGNSFQAAESFVSPGNVIINEINWVGSDLTGQTGQNDEWLELRNTTSNPISLAGWKITGAVIGDGDLDIPSGSIPADGFFLISNFDETTSRINLAPDLVTTSIQLDNADAQYILKDNVGNTIDTADDGSGSPLAGTNGPQKRSMERKTPPGDGTLGTNWQDATTHTNMDGSGSTDEFGTPKAENGT